MEPVSKRVLSSVRTRVILIILLAILPLAGCAVLLAWANYRQQVQLSARRLDATLSDYLAREREALQAADASLGALARLVQPSGAACGPLLDVAASLAPAKYDSLGVIRSGRVLCAGTGGAPLVPSPADGGVGHATRAQDGSMVVPIARPLAADPGSLLVGGLRLERPVNGSTAVGAWVVDPDGRAFALSRSPAAFPGMAVLDRLAGHRSLAELISGVRTVFVSGPLPGGNLVVMGGQATEEEARAARLLVEHMVIIGAILAAALVLVTIGAHVTVAAPIQVLTRRVTRWRTAGRFDDTGMRFVTVELAELVDAFGLATRALALREKELEKARLEQELAFKEIHHRVKNNLQIIASLLNLQANRIVLPEAKAEFQSARDRVRALATLHRHLYAEGGLYAIAMRSFLIELCEQLLQAMGEQEGHRIRLDIDSPELQMSSDQAVPLALIVTEAVSNAVKYAFPGGRSGSISVRLCLLEGGRVSLTIQDDGVGIPAGRAETETGVRDGLGLQLIRGFARQLGASLEVTEGEGTRYDLQLRLHPADEDRPRAAEPVA